MDDLYEKKSTDAADINRGMVGVSINIGSTIIYRESCFDMKKDINVDVNEELDCLFKDAYSNYKAIFDNKIKDFLDLLKTSPSIIYTINQVLKPVLLVNVPINSFTTFFKQNIISLNQYLATNGAPYAVEKFDIDSGEYIVNIVKNN